MEELFKSIPGWQCMNENKVQKWVTSHQCLRLTDQDKDNFGDDNTPCLVNACLFVTAEEGFKALDIRI